MEAIVETIKTKAYGEIQVEEESAIYFKREILGFEDFHYYYLIEMGDLPNFYWLQSKEEPELAFIVVNPRLFKSNYELKLDDVDSTLLELSEGDEIADFAIVNIPEDVNMMTMNLLGPIVINVKKRVAIQGISLNNDYGTKVMVFSTETEAYHKEKKEEAKAC
jgi:flagellar assembly factor FliW